MAIIYDMLINNTVYVLCLIGFVSTAVFENYRDFTQLGINFPELGYTLGYQIMIATGIPLLIFLGVTLLMVTINLSVTHQIAGPLYRLRYFLQKWTSSSIVERGKLRLSDHYDCHRLFETVHFTFAGRVLAPEEKKRIGYRITKTPLYNFNRLRRQFRSRFLLLGLLNVVITGGYYLFFFNIFENIQGHLSQADVHRDIQQLYNLEVHFVKSSVLVFAFVFSIILLVANLMSINRLFKPIMLIHQVCLDLITAQHFDKNLNELKFSRKAIYHDIGHLITELIHLKVNKTLYYSEEEKMQATSSHRGVAHTRDTG